MTKQELRDYLATTFYKVGLPQGGEKDKAGYLFRMFEGFVYYAIGVYEKSDDGVVLRRNIHVQCDISGVKGLMEDQIGYLDWDKLPEGEYFIAEKPVQAKTIQVLKPNVWEGIEFSGEVERVNNKYVIIRKFVPENGEMVEKRFYVEKNEANELVETPIKQITQTTI